MKAEKIPANDFKVVLTCSAREAALIMFLIGRCNANFSLILEVYDSLYNVPLLEELADSSFKVQSPTTFINIIERKTED